MKLPRSPVVCAVSQHLARRRLRPRPRRRRASRPRSDERASQNLGSGRAELGDPLGRLGEQRVRLVEATEHRQAGDPAGEERCAARRAGARRASAGTPRPASRLVVARGPAASRPVDHERDRPPDVHARATRSAAAAMSDAARAPCELLGDEQRTAGDREPPLVAGRLEHRQRLLGELDAARVDVPLRRRIEHELVVRLVQTQGELADAIAGGAARSRPRARPDITASGPWPVLKRAQPSSTSKRPSRRSSGSRSAARSSRLSPASKVLSHDRSAPGERQPLAGPCGRALLRPSSCAELLPVAIGLLEVVAEQLVELDELGCRALRASRRTARAAPPAPPSGERRRRRRA